MSVMSVQETIEYKPLQWTSDNRQSHFAEEKRREKSQRREII